MTHLSVAMATYNGARFLSRQLDSLLAQRRQPDELVITDDGSSDDTLAILADFAARAPFPVRVHRNAMQFGYRANFLHCASLCSGDLIAFCDQDDVWLPEKLAAQAADFADPAVLLSCHNVLLVDQTGASLNRMFQQHPMQPRFAFADSRPFSYSIGFTLVFRRRLLAFADLWPISIDENAAGERMAHDQWFSFLATVLGVTVFHKEVLAHYRQHDRNTSGPRQLAEGRRWDPEMLRKRQGEYRQLVAAAANRSELLGGRVARATATERPFVAAAQAGYAKWHAVLKRRASIYFSVSALQGFARLLGSLVRGDYRPGDDGWHFTPRNALRDALLVGSLKRETAV